MAIVDKIKAMIRRKGGSVAKTNTIEANLKALDKTEVNPLAALLVDASIGGSVDLLGKVVGDLEKDMEVRGTDIYGTLKYVTGYTGFSGLEEEQEGNYLALYYRVPDMTGVTIKVKGGSGNEVTLDPDGLHILRIKDADSLNKKIVVTASKEGYETVRRAYSVAHLELESGE